MKYEAVAERHGNLYTMKFSTLDQAVSWCNRMGKDTPWEIYQCGLTKNIQILRYRPEPEVKRPIKLMIGGKYVVNGRNCTLKDVEVIPETLYAGNAILKTIVNYDCYLEDENGFGITVDSKELTYAD